MRARRTLAAATLAAVAAGTAAATLAATSGTTAATTATVQTGLATVVRTDLDVQDAVPGTVGYDSQYAIYGPAGTAAQAVAQLQQAATADQLTVSADRAAVADTGNGADHAIDQQQVAFANAQAAQRADQAQAAQDQAQERADQHTASAATTTDATDTARLANDTAAQRNEQLVQLADQQQLAAAQHNEAQDQAVLTAASQQQAAATQALDAAQQHVEADQAAVGRDCPAVPFSPQCTAEQAQLARDQQQAGQDQSAVAAEQATVTADQTAVGDDEAAAATVQQRLDAEARTLLQLGFTISDDAAAAQQGSTALGSAKAAVTTDEERVAADTVKTSVQDPAAVSTAQAALGAAQASGATGLHQAAAKLVLDAAALRAAQAAAAAAAPTALGAATALTWLPRAGQTITEGEPVYALDGRPVPLLYGLTPLFRTLQLGVPDGPDVGEVNADLGLPQSDHFSPATATALQAWQNAHGLAPTGALSLGTAIAEPGPLRVSAVDSGVGTALGSNAILEATSTALVVTAQIPLSDVGLVNPGAAVTVDLPNGHNGVAGRVRDIGSVTPSSGSVSQGQQQQQQQDQSGQAPVTSVDATVTLSDGSVARGLAQAAVLVHVTTQTVHGALAVPVDALLALAGGGEGVEVVTGARHDVIPVTTGVFTGTQVEVSGAGLSAGEQVEVPAA
jgi:hypothetical protein